jgi:hypothetical protein
VSASTALAIWSTPSINSSVLAIVTVDGRARAGDVA